MRLGLSPRPFKEFVYELWQRWKAQPGKEEWRVMAYVVHEDGQLAIDLTYPEDVDVEEDGKVIYPDPFA